MTAYAPCCDHCHPLCPGDRHEVPCIDCEQSTEREVGSSDER